VLDAADQLLRIEVVIERDDALADVLGVIADPLQVIAYAHGADAFAQIDRHRLAPGNREDAFIFHFALQRVDRWIEPNHALAELDIAIDQGLNRIRDLSLHKAAHLGDFAGDFLQIGIERLGGMVDSGGGYVAHLRYPKRPVM
jgi:hypothetical protein